MRAARRTSSAMPMGRAKRRLEAGWGSTRTLAARPWAHHHYLRSHRHCGEGGWPRRLARSAAGRVLVGWGRCDIIYM